MNRVLALGNLNLISDSMQACEQMMLRGDAQFLLCHHHKDASGRIDVRPVQEHRGRRRHSTSAQRAGRKRRGTVAASRRRAAKIPGLQRAIGAGPDRRSPMGQAKDRALALETVFTSHLAATLLSMARAGDGVAWLPRTLAEEDISAGLLVEAGGPELDDTDRNPAVSPGRASKQRGRSDLVGLRMGLMLHGLWCVSTRNDE